MSYPYQNASTGPQGSLLVFPAAGSEPAGEPWGRRPPFNPIVRGVCNIDVRTGLASCRIAPPPHPYPF